jgi:hypothetical protein
MGLLPHDNSPTRTPDMARWAGTLGRLAQAPLDLCEDFPVIASRFEAWWAGQLLDRPIFIAAANTDPDRPITRRLDLLERPDEWLEAKGADMLQLHRVGDALPHIRVDFGPVLLGSLFGGSRELGADTSWTHPFIDDDWANAPDWTIPADHPHWSLMRRLLGLVADDAAGRHLVCTPDLGGSGDVLLNLRGAAGLCTDILGRSQCVKKAVEAIYPSWRTAFSALYRETVEHGAGLIHWLGLWSNKPYVVPACDFSALIGPDHFAALFLPDIARQAAAVGRAVFHLDGPDAARHIDLLLDVPEIQAIQFTPGAGTPSALAWVDMFKKIQSRGRSLLVFCPTDEVLRLCDELRPEGLAIALDEPVPPADLDALFECLCRRFATADSASRRQTRGDES